ncbi:MAG TPA: type II toxin-antitoxin system RelE/ParE family toxin [Polyangiaceae bacterium]|jgi:phage-related protein
MAAARKPVLGCSFYRSTSGAEPVREWLRGLASAIRLEIGSDIERVQWRWPLGHPTVGSFGGGLYEVRTSLDGNIYRVFFCIKGANLVLLHGFQKKTQRTPQTDVDLAKARQKEVMS